MASEAPRPTRGVRSPGIPEVLALLAAASFLVARFLPVLDAGVPCPFRAATGLPCASCGMTHAFVAMARGDLASAWSASPLGAVLAAGAWLLALAALARLVLGLPRPRLSSRVQRVLAAGVLSAAAINWGWMVFRAVAA